MPNSLPFEASSADNVSSTYRASGVSSKSFSTPARRPPASEDEVRANALSHALSEFLLSRADSGPLVISVEGDWGCGRSTFLLTLEQHLRERTAAKPAKGITHHVPVIAKFNPSRHSKDEPLWVAFTGHLTRKIIREQNPIERWKGHVRVFLWPFRRRRGWLDDLKTGTGRRLSLLRTCFKDLRRVVEAYARDKMIWVFVEDLDRCAVPQAMELMQAINLLISTELKSIVIVIGVGRIPGRVANKHADVLSQFRNRARCISIVS